MLFHLNHQHLRLFYSFEFIRNSTFIRLNH
eukprot:UN01051